MLVVTRPVLSFVSTRFLYPTDSGGKIRTTQVLRGLKNGAFFVRLLMPCTDFDRATYASEIELVCDELVSWIPDSEWRPTYLLRKASGIVRSVPIPVWSDWSRRASIAVERELKASPDVVVFDFPHSAILAPERINCPSVIFTHNIEAEIFKRHMEVAESVPKRWLWRNQYRKMLNYERHVLRKFDICIAVSERDKEFFDAQYGVTECRAIPTGVDTDYFNFSPPKDGRTVVFCGSMDWLANIDGISYFADQVWPIVRKMVPNVRMKVVGRSPPQSLVRNIRSKFPEWEFSGYVDDVREHVHGAGAFVIPLRVGGGTRIKAFEAMAMGAPVVSTSIGVEGLPLEPGTHYLRGDTPQEMAEAIVALLSDRERRHGLAMRARQLVDDRFRFIHVSRIFEQICQDAIVSRPPDVA